MRQGLSYLVAALTNVIEGLAVCVTPVTRLLPFFFFLFNHTRI